MDNVDELYEEFKKETNTLDVEMYHQSYCGAIKHYYSEKFCEWLADKLEESRKEKASKTDN
jgi:hypothetical protein